MFAEYSNKMANRNKLKTEIVVKDKATGDLQIIDMITGELISSSSKKDLDANLYKFDYAKALLVCQEISQGKTLEEISILPDMPPLHIIQHWQRSDRMFAEEMMLARRMRAEVYHDRVVEIANNAAHLRYSTKEDIANAKLAADQYKWLAEKGDPSKYSNKVVHEGSTEKPIVMRVINTGISREAPDVITTAITKEESNDSEEREEDV